MRTRPDSWLLVISIMLLLFGTVMIYSTSAIFAERRFQSDDHFLWSHILHIVVGLAAMAAGYLMNYPQWQRRIPLLMVLTLVLLVAVLIPGIGHEVKGGRRWIRFFGIGIQPSELLKIVVIFYVASYLDRKQDVLASFFRGISPNFIVLGGYLSLVLLQPDFGTVVLTSLTVLLMIYIGGAKPFHIFGSVLCFSLIAAFLVMGHSYRLRRLLAFMNPWDDPLDAGFQIIQSFIALGTGGWFGRGLAESRQKLFFLPDAHTDFIFAIVGEELGFIGVSLLIVTLGVFIWRGYQIARRAQDSFGRYLAFGITTLLALQIVFNIYVVTGLLPTKGLPLPFISAGGTSLVVTLFMTGLLLNISRGPRVEEEESAPLNRPLRLG